MAVVTENVHSLLEILDPDGPIPITSDAAQIELDRINRENLAAAEVFLTVCSIAFSFTGMGGIVGRGTTSFGRTLATRFPNAASRLTTRFPSLAPRLGLETTALAPEAATPLALPAGPRPLAELTPGPRPFGELGPGPALPNRFGPLNPGPLADDVAVTFRSTTYDSVTAGEPTTLYRVFSDPTRRLGPFWTRTPPSGPVQSIVDSALAPSWGNQATSWVQIRVPAGTTFYEGTAAAQGSLVGGGSQVFLPTVDDAWIIASGGF
jgi:hypothetical protein